MKKDEMQNLVDKIAEERKQHIQTIENLTLKDIKRIVSSAPRLPFSATQPCQLSNPCMFVQNRKSYVPKRKTKDELHLEAKAFVKQSWKGSGIGGEIFSQAPIMKPKLLDPWTLSRVQAPEKASTKFFFSKLLIPEF